MEIRQDITKSSDGKPPIKHSGNIKERAYLPPFKFNNTVSFNDVKFARRFSGLSVTAAANLIGVPIEQWERWERQDTMPEPIFQLFLWEAVHNAENEDERKKDDDDFERGGILPDKDYLVVRRKGGVYKIVKGIA